MADQKFSQVTVAPNANGVYLLGQKQVGNEVVRVPVSAITVSLGQVSVISDNYAPIGIVAVVSAHTDALTSVNNVTSIAVSAITSINAAHTSLLAAHVSLANTVSVNASIATSINAAIVSLRSFKASVSHSHTGIELGAWIVGGVNVIVSASAGGIVINASVPPGSGTTVSAGNLNGTGATGVSLMRAVSAGDVTSILGDTIVTLPPGYIYVGATASVQALPPGGVVSVLGLKPFTLELARSPTTIPDGVYTLTMKAPFAFNIGKLYTICSAGSAGLTTILNGATTVGGLVSVTTSASLTPKTASSGTSVAANGTVTLLLFGSSNMTGYGAVLSCRRSD